MEAVAVVAAETVVLEVVEVTVDEAVTVLMLQDIQQ